MYFRSSISPNSLVYVAPTCYFTSAIHLSAEPLKDIDKLERYRRKSSTEPDFYQRFMYLYVVLTPIRRRNNRTKYLHHCKLDARLQFKNRQISLTFIHIRNAVHKNCKGLQVMKSAFLQSVRDSIRKKHYSIKTEQTYIYWISYFIRFHQLKHPKLIGENAIRAFLDYLVLKRDVTASTQKTALNAIRASNIHKPASRINRTSTFAIDLPK